MRPLNNKPNQVVEEMPKNLTTYLGQKGYTLLKSELTIKQQTYIKEQLTVKPYVPGSPVQLQKSFPAYRESDKKLYIPRYYGDEIFGQAAQYKLTDGNKINIKFEGTLRPQQEPVEQRPYPELGNLAVHSRGRSSVLRHGRRLHHGVHGRGWLAHLGQGRCALRA